MALGCIKDCGHGSGHSVGLQLVDVSIRATQLSQNGCAVSAQRRYWIHADIEACDVSGRQQRLELTSRRTDGGKTLPRVQLRMRPQIADLVDGGVSDLSFIET